MRIPRVLMGTPTSDRHSHLIDEWISHLNSLTYPFDLFLLDTTKDSKYYNKLKKIKFTRGKLIVKKYKHRKDELHPLQMLAHAREQIRKYFLKYGYHSMMWLDDDIFLPKRGIQKLLSHNKDCVGFYTHVFYKPNRKPGIFKGDGSIKMGKGWEHFKFSEIKEYYLFAKKFKSNQLTKKEKQLVPFIIRDEKRPFIFRTYGTNLGCLLCKREVMEKTQFRTHPTFIYGEDLWFFVEANDKRFEFWCDSSHRCKHKNTEWNSVLYLAKKEMGFRIMAGQENKLKQTIKEYKNVK